MQPSPLPRRDFLRAASGSAAAGLALPAGLALDAVGTAPSVHSGPAAPGTDLVAVRFTRATNGAATVAARSGRIVAEVQNVLWAVPRDGSPATPLTPPDLEPTRPVFSPDGRTVAMSAFRGGFFALWVMHADGSGLRRLTGGPFDDRAPAWSPDGTRLAFSSERGGDPVTGSPYRVWTVDVRDGRLTRLTGLPGQAGPGQDGPWEDFDPVWSADGSRVLFVRGRFTAPALVSRTIASVPAAPGDTAVGPVVVEHTAAEGNLLTPAVSPAGRIAWLHALPGPRTDTITLFVDGEPVRLEGDLAPAPPRWADDERLLLTVDGRFRIVRPHRDRTGTGTSTATSSGTAVPLDATLRVRRPRYTVKSYALEAERPRPARGVHLPQLSPDGRHIAFAALNALWTVGTSGGTPRRIVAAPATAYVQGPVWSPDGRALIWTDDRTGLNTVRRRDLADGTETVLTPAGRVQAVPSPDGTRLACLDLAGNLVVRDLAAGTERTLAAPLGGGGLPGRPSWSPDGRRIALCDRNRLNFRFREGHNLVRVVDTVTAESRLHAVGPYVSLSDRYASGPVWSPDGRWLACVSESALWLLPVDADGTPTGAALLLTDEPADHPSWSGDARTLLYQSNGRLRLLRVDAEGHPAGPPRTVPVSLDVRRPAPVDTVVHAGLLWDGTGTPPRSDVDVLITDGRIRAVEPHRPGRPAARSVDASGQTVLPGLWDAHTHPWPYTYGARQGALYLAYGITTTVSLGGFAYEQARLRDDIAAGALVAPRLLATGELLDGSRVGYSMGRAHRTRAGLARSLARGTALDWDFVKTYVRAPYDFMAAAADRAHEGLGVLSGSHLCSAGLQSGQDLTTHLIATERAEYGHGATPGGHTYEDTEHVYTEGRFQLIATPFTAIPLIGADPSVAADRRVRGMMPPWDVQTVDARAVKPPSERELGVLEREVGLYRRVLRDGGEVVLGTDAPLTPVGLHLHLGLRALHRYGLSPAEALTTVTSAPARVFGAERDLGTVAAGRLADLTIVDGDPFADFDTLIRVVTAVRGGTVHERSALEDAFPAPGPTGRAAGTDWGAVADLMTRDGCCDQRHG
ncbi:amidohydrolase family protein [Streptomyces yaizuensis]|uniref:Amidohydrolase family protein n=1 Tax=Streptomyces yaizuensis TaxID=2989713 RepID=A0ABQ5NWY3_9ACTN|nr:amidohydrolase family protein [Streptomyces sp. YSPA8]GLF94871.1 amidohydrolase family protein [Streptomyces sp. YSPA8]